MKPAFPEVYRLYVSRRRRRLGVVIPTVLGLQAWLVYSSLLGSTPLWVGATAIVLGTIVILATLPESCTGMFPYFERRLIGGESWLWYRAIAYNCSRLDRIAEAAALPTFSEFGFADDLNGERPDWHEAARVLPTISLVIDAVLMNPGLVDTPQQVLYELVCVRERLALAQRQNTRFCFLLRYGHGGSVQEFMVRGGFF